MADDYQYQRGHAAGMDRGMKERFAEQEEQIATLRAEMKAAFEAGRHHGHSEAVLAVRDHCNLYHGWKIHKTLDEHLKAAREAGD